MQYSFFEEEKTVVYPKGLIYIPNFLTQNEEKQVLSTIDNQVWLSDLKRRVQHYGYKYDYKARNIDNSMKIGVLPEWLKNIAARLYEEKYFAEMPDQVIVNEYIAGQGISAHIDCEPCFGDTIVSITLGSGCMMDFTHINTKEKISLFLEPCSAVILKSESRYDWQHSIPARKSDNINGALLKRNRRVSLTFRKIIL